MSVWCSSQARSFPRTSRCIATSCIAVRRRCRSSKAPVAASAAALASGRRRPGCLRCWRGSSAALLPPLVAPFNTSCGFAVRPSPGEPYPTRAPRQSATWPCRSARSPRGVGQGFRPEALLKGRRRRRRRRHRHRRRRRCRRRRRQGCRKRRRQGYRKRPAGPEWRIGCRSYSLLGSGPQRHPLSPRRHPTDGSSGVGCSQLSLPSSLSVT